MVSMNWFEIGYWTLLLPFLWINVDWIELPFNGFLVNYCIIIIIPNNHKNRNEHNGNGAMTSSSQKYPQYQHHTLRARRTAKHTSNFFLTLLDTTLAATHLLDPAPSVQSDQRRAAYTTHPIQQKVISTSQQTTSTPLAFPTSSFKRVAPSTCSTGRTRRLHYYIT